MSRSPQASRCTTKCQSAMPASATSSERACCSCAARGVPPGCAISNSARAASAASSARPSRPSAGLLLGEFVREQIGGGLRRLGAGSWTVIRGETGPQVGLSSQGLDGRRPIGSALSQDREQDQCCRKRRSTDRSQPTAGGNEKLDEFARWDRGARRARPARRRRPAGCLARDPEGRGPAARRLGRRACRARPARRHLQEARA